ncbi:S8 family peptidase [Aequorivita antarctica]|uniref:S8 family serine peptidase n=1 Tax=Aequorivita antarctica TaxID=153266 RepID=A0A5C6YXG0_9FLAO|nr:S8 family peptidase [Aequorivita antarctica]TXD72097.1 S8 family serine peptidase [Aequorivita antarctica]SRX75223.1 Serine protease AprX [Aequorivita antarctica]
MMKKLSLLILVFVSTFSFAQTEDALVFMVAKDPAVVSAALAAPITIMTQAAIDRKNTQGIAIDDRDVPLNETQKAAIDAATGITVLAKSKWLNAVYVRGTENNINNLLNLPFVTDIEFADKSLNRPTGGKQITKDKFEVENQFPSRPVYNYGSATNQTEMINVDYLHANDYTGQDIVVAFMDNGYPGVLTNPAYATLRNEGRLKGYYDFVARVEDPNGTGSHGAGTFSDAAGFLNGQFVGTAPGASYYLYITEDNDNESPAEEAFWVEALERADSLGVYVTNTSLSYQTFDNTSFDHEYPDLDGLTTIAARGSNIGFDKGMINVVSAGNAGNDFGFVATPSDAPGSFTIGAVDANENYVSFSSRGPNASGVIKPDVMAKGLDAAIVSQNGNVTTASGTSFSSPITAGAVASLWSAVPNLKNDVVMQAIRESADRYSNPTDQYGYGIPNFGDALNSLLVIGVEEQMLDTNFALYPNPVTTQINISFPKNSENAEFTLFNILGERILQTNITTMKNRIDVSRLASGMYIASITSNNKTTSYKIIKE